VHYVGKYCEIPVPEPCGNHKSVFCVNGGTCRSDLYVQYMCASSCCWK
jgi:hypothetical protein